MKIIGFMLLRTLLKGILLSNKANKTIGTVIDNKDVLGYYVWIPRFRYKLWNVADGQEGYNAYDNGIDIMFENGLGSITNEIVNNNYITHPVFKDNLRGFWVSKYEISNDNDNYRFIPNVESYHNDTVDNYNKIIDLIQNMVYVLVMDAIILVLMILILVLIINKIRQQEMYMVYMIWLALVVNMY